MNSIDTTKENVTLRVVFTPHDVKNLERIQAASNNLFTIEQAVSLALQELADAQDQ